MTLVVALLCGIVAHALKQYLTARRVQSSLTARMYFLTAWPETVIAVACAWVLWAGLPELAALAPEFSKSLGLTGEQGVISSFACGFIGNSLADVLGGRAKAITGG